MIIGYSTHMESLKSLTKVCDDVYYQEPSKQTAKTFLSFVQANRTNQIVVNSVKDIGLQLVQMTPALLELKREDREIIFLEKVPGQATSSRTYNRLLLELAKNEQEIMRTRTVISIEKSQARGVKHGRPKVDEEVIKRIQQLSETRKWSVREIAKACHVSVGTVHKYGRK